MRFPSVSDVVVMKPKKDGSTYFASFSYLKKSQPLVIHLDSVACIKSKQNLYVKSKAFMNYMVDLNEHIVETVKSKCSSWFNSNMDTELIDEYYVNPLKYDKENGYLVKIGESDVESGKYTLTLEATGLRFLKQKFNIEWSILEISQAEEIEFAIDDDNESEELSEEDIPEPIPDDVNDMKEKYNNTLDGLLEKYLVEYNRIKDIVSSLQKAKSEIADFTSLAEFFVIDDLVETLQ